MNCRTCASLSGEHPICPGSEIYDGTYWKVEHAYPVSLKGWLVIVLKRHAEALHEVLPVEFEELARLQSAATTVLHRALGCPKEYLAQFAEKEGFSHVHIHVIARPADLDPALKGPHIFAHLRSDAEQVIPAEEIAGLCVTLRDTWRAISS